MLKNFWKDESGAVTVDWTVMTAGIVGLGIATYGVVSGGIESLATNTDTHLRTNWIHTNFGPRTFAAMDFSNGDAGGWVGGTVMPMFAGMGESLILGPRETASVTLDVPDGAKTATLSFDLLGGDSLDSEVATITTNGQTVTLARGYAEGQITFTTPNVEGVTVKTEVISEQTDLGGRGWKDSVTRVTVSMDDPGKTLELGMTSGATSVITDEFFGIDNVNIAAQ